MNQQSRFFRAILLIALLAISFNTITVVRAENNIQAQGIESRQSTASATASIATNAYAGPSTAFWIVGTINRFETLPVLAISADGAWWLVNGRFGQGWVVGTALTVTNGSSVGIQDPGAFITVTATLLNVRSGPGPEAAIQGRLSAGQRVYLIGQSNDGTWLNIRWQFGNGWVQARFTSAGDAAPTTDASSAPVTEVGATGVVNAGSLNVRSGPGVNYEIIGTVVGGELLPILGRSSDNLWFNVQTVFGEGWVSARYLITRNDFGNAPVTENTVDQTTYVGPVAVINAGALNIRSGPGAAYTILGRTVGGEQFVILARDAAFLWVQIDTDFGAGWVNRNYVIIRGDVSALPIADATTAITVRDPATGDTSVSTPTLIGPVAFVATGALNIRSGPNSSFSSLGSVPSTTRMPIIGLSPDRRWWKVQSPFGDGWVNRNYVLVEGDASGVPVVSQ
ncbi:MAG: SH3 domain-containing protein [Chloroflexi bacterium]|nr:SH3 domain-containing protein [Chloroflexota bacterium]